MGSTFNKYWEPKVPIYSENTPLKCVYPPSVEILWQDIEKLFIRATLEASTKINNDNNYYSICHFVRGEILYPKTQEYPHFEIVGIKWGVPPSHDNYDVLFSSDNLPEWHEFVSKMALLDFTLPWEDAPLSLKDKKGPTGCYSWRDLLEEQYIVCALRALRYVRNLGSFKNTTFSNSEDIMVIATEKKSWSHLQLLCAFDDEDFESILQRSLDLTALDGKY